MFNFQNKNLLIKLFLFFRYPHFAAVYSARVGGVVGVDGGHQRVHPFGDAVRLPGDV